MKKVRTATLTTLLAQAFLVGDAWGHPGHAETSMVDVLIDPLTLVLIAALAFGVVLARRRSLA